MSKPKNKPRYYFFCSPYVDAAFMRCPKCEGLTKLRKFCLVVHVEPRGLMTLKMGCRLCPYCELIIKKESELEAVIATACEEGGRLDQVGNEYLVMGTIDRALHERGKKGELMEAETFENLTPFRDRWDFEPPQYWVKAGG